MRNILVFAGLGLFSYTLIINFSEFYPDIADILHSGEALVYTILAFIVVGYSALMMVQSMSRQYLIKAVGKFPLYAAHLLAGMLVLLINYSLLVFAKILADVSPVYCFSNSGWLLLLIIWMAEMTIMEMMISNYTANENARLKREASQLMLENSEARYAALQAQLNPHFLFNCLNTLKAEIRYDPSGAEKFTQHLSNVYRYVLQCQNRRMVPLSEELEFLDSYMFLHKVRLGDCISCENDVPEEFMGGEVPPLCLQMLVENVIKHNSISASKPMVINITSDGEYLKVTNRKSPKKTKDNSTGIGLKNLSSRCQMMTGQDMMITDKEDSFSVGIPMKYEED
ncbi:MAG: sensor histidine kinase [Candidatus Cryptobacteroides sp.]